jgi:hypothetical protein
MKKAKPNLGATAAVECPVLPIAVRISELWDAHTRAQELHEEREQSEFTAEQIDKLRIATEGMASFERAWSMSGALFQVALARDAAHHLYEHLPPEKNLHVIETYEKLNRLLESVALLLREKIAPAEFAPVQSVIRLYLDVDGDVMVRPFEWMDDIQRLAKEYRSEQVDHSGVRTNAV